MFGMATFQIKSPLLLLVMLQITIQAFSRVATRYTLYSIWIHSRPLAT